MEVFGVSLGTYADVAGTLALIVAIWLARRQVKFTRRFVAIEEAREADRLAEASRAQIGATLRSGNGTAVLEIFNSGSAPAREVGVFVEGVPIEDFSEYLTGSGPDSGFVLAAHTGRVAYKCVRRLGENVNHPPWTVRVAWHDEAGEQEMETTVGY